jgi:hypothetical protein
VGFAGGTAHAAPADEAARKLRDQAVDTDYLATDFDQAQAHLRQALDLCKQPGDCSPAVRARIMCDLGVMDFVQHRADEARALFAAALKEDPTVTVDRDLSTADLRREFAAVRDPAAASAAPAEAPPAPATSPDAPAAPPADVAHADCPPEFPGCGGSATASAACVSDEECREGQLCRGGACVESGVREPAPHERNWVSVAFQTDALLLPYANNACAGGTGYTCFGSGGSYYANLPLAGADDEIGGGVALATSRVLLGYDRSLGENFTVGARIGYALGGGPQRPGASSFLPIHLEARTTYWFGSNPLARSGFRFFALAAGGMAQIDASVPVDVYANLQAYESQQSQDYRAWKKTGLAFVALGGGSMYAITPSTGVVLEAKGLEMFPTTATGFSLQLAYVVGL